MVSDLIVIDCRRSFFFAEKLVPDLIVILIVIGCRHHIHIFCFFQIDKHKKMLLM